MLDHVLSSLAGVGADRTYVVTNAKFAPQFREWAADRPDVTVVDDGTTSDDDKLGAIGDIAFVIEQEEIDDDLLVVAGDNLFSADLARVRGLLPPHRAPVLAVYDVGDLAQMSKYNALETDDRGRLTHFEEKPAAPTSTLAGIALYFYPRRALPLVRRYVEEGNNPDQPGRLIQWLYPRIDVFTWPVPGEWFDIGSEETLRAADARFSHN